jgi:hypothetical protein
MKPILKKFLIAAPVVLIAGGAATYLLVNQQAKTVVDERLAALVESGSYETLTYEEMEVGLGGAITMKNLHVVQGPLDYTLEDITITNFDFVNEFPRTMDISVTGLQIAAIDPDITDPQMMALAGMLQQFDIDEQIPLQVDYSHRYDPDNAHQTDSKVHLTVTDSFTLDAASVTRGVPMETLNGLTGLDQSDPVAAQQQVAALLADAEFPSMQMSLQDQGLVETLITRTAERSDVPPEDFRNLLVSQSRNMFLFLPPTAQNLAMAIGTEVAEFLEGGKTLSISIAPEYNGSLQRLQEEVMGAVFTGNYDKVSELLHLEVVTE